MSFAFRGLSTCANTLQNSLEEVDFFVVVDNVK